MFGQYVWRFVSWMMTGVEEPERGDVPGWVLITLMTAALVAAIWAVANEALLGLFDQAIARFSGR